MASKTLVGLGVLLATVLLVSSQLATAREVAEQQEKKINGVGDVDLKYGDDPVVSGGDTSCHHGCCKWGHHHHCIKCCMTADEIPEEKKANDVGAVDQKYGDNPVVNGGDAGCHHGCCKWGYHHHCIKCCMAADEPNN